MLLLLINILIIIVVGALLFWAIDKFVRDGGVLVRFDYYPCSGLDFREIRREPK